MKLFPVLWILIWSILAIRYVFRRESSYRWGAGGTGRTAPLWIARFLFIFAAAYGLLWAIVTGGGDLGYIQPTSKLASVLEFINAHVGLIFINAFLATVFLAFAFYAMRSLRHGSHERWSHTTAIALALAALMIGGFALIQVVHRLINFIH